MLQSGDVIGQYRIVEKIGEGGMGVVFRAEHRNLARTVAIKVLRQELSSRPDVVRRFFEEARAINDIHSSHIVEIHDLVDELERDPPLAYMVIELLSGQDLERWLDDVGPMAPDEVVTLGSQVAQALTAVHRSRRLHRDLKPENIFLVETDGVGPLVKLLDFGCVKALEGSSLDLTDPGTATGTPHYMAPEQITDQEIDERTDIYSLGVVLYRMLTNTVPLDAKSYGDLMLKLVMDRPKPVNERREDDAKVPDELETVVMKCLEKEPEQRYQSMEEVEIALARSLGREPRPNTATGSIEDKTDLSSEEPTEEPTKEPEKDPPIAATNSNRSVLVGAAVIAAVGLGAVIWALTPPRRADTTQPSAPQDPIVTPRTIIVPVAVDAGAMSVEKSQDATTTKPTRVVTRPRRRVVHPPKPRLRPDAGKPAPTTKVVSKQSKTDPPAKAQPKTNGKKGSVTNWIREPTFD